MAFPRGRRGESFTREFEGEQVLTALLATAGSPLDTEGALTVLRQAHAEGAEAAAAIPDLFDGEPRFSDPEQARQLFQNLLGLWDLIVEGKPVDLSGPREKVPRAKKVRANPPGPFGAEGPDEGWVERAWKYLEEAAPRDRDPLEHAFENRHDALLAHLDEQGLSDEGYGLSRHLLFELFAMIELGWPPGTRAVSQQALAHPEGLAAEVPAALRAHAEEGLFEATQDEESPLSPAESAKVQQVVERAYAALWHARRPT